MLLFLNLTKIACGTTAIVLGVSPPESINDVEHVSSALLVFGIILLAHDLFFEVVGLVKSLRATNQTGCRLWNWLVAKVAIPPSVSEFRLGLEGEKQLLTWLVSASGVIIGLIAFDQGTIPVVEKIGAGALLATIVAGILYMNVLAGGVSAENTSTVTVDGFNHQLSVILVNVAYWAFVFGLLSIVFGLFNQAAT